MAGQYQSKVFNFLNRQSWRLRDQSAQSWRNLKLTAVWGVQILLYPIYVAFQTSRLVDKQLQQTVKQVMPRLRAAGQQIFNPEPAAMLSPNQPIQRTLDSIASLQVTASQGEELLLLPADSQPDVEQSLALRWRSQIIERATLASADLSAKLAPTDPAIPELGAVRVQGVASQLADRRIVLVTTRNQVLDVLTVEQQSHLARRMVAEAAIYWQQQRQFNPPNDRWWVTRDLPLPKVRAQTIAPIRAFQQLMGWMQQGSLAVAADLFHESRFAQPVLPAHLQMAMIGSADAATAQLLRSAQPTWVTVEAQFYDWLAQAGQAMQSGLIEILMRGQRGLAKWQGSSRDEIRSADFRSSSIALPASRPPSDVAVLPATSKFPRTDRHLDRWLSQLMGSAPGLVPPAALPPQSASPQLRPENGSAPVLPAQSTQSGSIVPQPVDRSAALPSPPRTTFGAWIRSALQPWIDPAQPQPSETWETVDPVLLEKITQNRLSVPPVVNELDSSSTESGLPVTIRPVDALPLPLSSLDPTTLDEAALMSSTWIETEAELVGYVKHPLEQLLEWLDQGMMWVETRIARLWQWILRPFR